MPHYMYQASYSPEAIKTLVNNPQDRTGAAKAAIEANGGTMIGAWMAFGGDDLVVIADMPDDAPWLASRWQFPPPEPLSAGKPQGSSICPRPLRA